EVRDGISMIETFDVRPILLSRGCWHVCCRRKFHLTLENRREYLVEVGLLATNNCAIRKRDADWRRLHASLGNIDEYGSAVEQTRPFSRIFGACNLAVGTVNQCVRAVSDQPTSGDFASIQLLSHHGLDWVPPERNDRTKKCLRHG